MSKTILITGASTGIGAETARRLAKDNTILIHYNRSQKEAERVAAEVGESGGRAELLQADLSTEAGCSGLVDAVTERVTALDVLVNNAGGLIRRLFTRELDWRLMEEIFSLNVFSTMIISTLCVPLLEKGVKPCIVNISSIAMRTGAPSATIYGASKGAIDSFTRGMAKELAPEIRINAVAPGVIETPFHEKVSKPEQLVSWRENTPLKKNGQAHHIALAIEFLIENDFMTGETVDVNGGLFMR
jgi:3-oxoacyl-[acyl-carrier protein] reductase